MSDETHKRLTRRTLLGGAALLPGLDGWYTAVAGSGITAAAALLSVPGVALAEVTGCTVAYSRDGAGQSCNPTFDCTSNSGHTTCGVQSGTAVACNSDSCVTMTGDYFCNPAECTNAFIGDCNSLNHCHTATGDCVALFDCDDLTGNCNGLNNCDDQGGGCNGLNTCAVHDGQCPDLTTCSCNNGSQGGSRRGKHRSGWQPDIDEPAMPYSTGLSWKRVR